jgi:hypothetical protein
MSINSSKGPLQVEAYKIAKKKGYVKTPEEVREEALGLQAEIVQDMIRRAKKEPHRVVVAPPGITEEGSDEESGPVSDPLLLAQSEALIAVNKYRRLKRSEVGRIESEETRLARIEMEELTIKVKRLEGLRAQEVAEEKKEIGSRRSGKKW